MANSVVVRSSVIGPNSPEPGDIVVQIVTDSRKVLGAGVRSEVTVTVNVLETVLLTVAVDPPVLWISAGAEETSQVFVAVSLLVQLLQKVRRLVTREVPHTIENR